MVRLSLLGDVISWRSGVGGGVGCARRFADRASGVTMGGWEVFDAVFLLDSAVLGVEKASVVCRETFVSASFAGVSLVCLEFAPLRGDDFFPLGLLGLPRFFRVDTIVDRS